MKITPETFFEEQAPPRIMAAECEYNNQGATNKVLLQHHHITEAFAPSDSGPEVFWRRTSNQLTSNRLLISNGAMLYPDVNHVEYAAPESRGPHEAAGTDLGGIEILQRIGATFSSDVSIYRRTGTAIPLPKWLQDGDSLLPTSFSSGYHLNALSPDAAALELAKSPILPTYLATRFWAFNGMMTPNGYVLSQKASGIGGHPISTYQSSRRTDHGSKPMVTIMLNGQDIDINGSNGYTRLETRYADAGLSRWGRFMDFAGLSLVIRAGGEHADKVKLDTDWMLRDPVSAARQISRDLSLAGTYQTNGHEGKYISAIDMQEMFGHALVKLSGQVELPANELSAIDELFQVCDDARACDPENHDYTPLRDAVDWAAKYHYLIRKLGTFELDEVFAEAAQLDLLWDRIYPEGPGLRYWSRVGGRQSILREGTVRRFTYNAPQHTRAAARGYHVKNSNVTDASWSYVKTQQGHGQPSRFLEQRDPYNPKR